MRTSIIIAAQALAVAALALPTKDGVDYSKIDYSHVDYSKVDFDKLDYSHVDYSKVDFSKLDYSHVDWSKIPLDKIDYSHVDWSKVPSYQKPDCKKEDNYPIKFTSTYHIVATPDQVVNASNITTGGLADAIGYYDFGINAHEDIICYRIELVNFRGEYQSPARTATHVHQANKGKNGPPRIAFPNPQPVEGKHELRRSVGCMQGPFTTGLNDTAGNDTGRGFKVAQIEQNPANFFADVHSSLAVPGAVRGQFA